MNSPHGREAVVNRLLGERDARLRRLSAGISSTTAAAPASGQYADNDSSARRSGRHSDSGATEGPQQAGRVVGGRRGCGDVIGAKVRRNVDAEGSSVGENSPVNRGDIFFASDLSGDPAAATAAAASAAAASGRSGGAGVVLFGRKRREETAVDMLLASAGKFVRGHSPFGEVELDAATDDESLSREELFGAASCAAPSTEYHHGRSSSQRDRYGELGGAGEATRAALLRSTASERPRVASSNEHRGDVFGRWNSAVDVCPESEGGAVAGGSLVERSRGDGQGVGAGRPGHEEDTATARLESQLSFRPKMNKRFSVKTGGEKKRASRECRIEELARDRQHVYSARERRRKEIQDEAETKECTFRPNFVAATGTGAAEDGRPDGPGGPRLPLHERLHKEAREREAAKALAQHHLEAELLRECTFQPALTAADAATSGQRPLHQRVWEVEREREYKLRLLQADKEEREGATFAPPPLGRVSQKLARDAKPASAAAGGGAWNGGAAARLKGQAMWANERRQLRLQEHEEAEARLSTFEPSISRGTESLVRKRPELQAPFEERRAFMDAKKREKERLRLAARDEEERKWFNPATAERTNALLRRRMPQRLEETVDERVARMAFTDDRRKRDRVNAQRAKEKRECTFRPALNPITQSMGQAAPLDELVNNRRGQRVRDQAQAKAREAQACTHKPVLVAEAALLQGREHRPRGAPGLSAGTSRADGGDCNRGTGNGNVDSRGRPDVAAGACPAATLYGPDNKYRLNVREPSRMTAELRAREREQGEKVRALQQEQDVAEMQRCTFVPRTNTNILRAQGPVIVRGLGRHLELRDVAQQQEEDRRARQAQAFGVRPWAVRRTALGETVLEPFALSEGNSRGWWDVRKRQHEEERAAQCTFKPWTVEGERSKALSRLLE